MAYAIIKTGGKQFLVEEGKTIRVPAVSAKRENRLSWTRW